jgi:circadian clock protein KaiC
MAKRADLAKLQRLSTGSAALDSILGGGLPERSVTILAGEPGAGKTVLALQLVFHLSRQGKRAHYFTTLSEPSLKLIRYMQQFAFFDADLLDDRVIFVDLGTDLLAKGAEEALEVAKRRVEREEPDVVVIDSFKAVHDLVKENGPANRRLVYQLAVSLASWGATTLLVGEYSLEDTLRLPEFAIADGIIRLGSTRQELTAIREIEILKLRGASYVTGRHFFEIGPNGLRFYPRVRAPEADEAAPAEVRARETTGLAELDAMFGGGPLRRSATLVEGGTGTGKTLLGLRFLLAGAELGEPGIHFGLEETPTQLRALAAAFGWDLTQFEARGLLRLSYTSPVELWTDRYLNEAREKVAEVRARRVVIDGLSSLTLGVPSDRRFKELVYSAVKHFRAADATVFMTLELEQLLSSGRLGGRAISSLADNVVLLRYVEVADRLERAVTVLKARGSAHENTIRHFTIDETGPHVGAPFRAVGGVLGGSIESAGGPAL